jgi:hypothetical protein
MGRTAVGWMALLCVLSAGCGDDDDVGTGGGGAGTTGASGSGRGGASAENGGTGGQTSTGSGGTGARAGAGGSGTGTSGAGNGAAGRAGSGAPGAGTSGRDCDLQCPDGQRCELVQVTCIRAPCNPVPECVPGGAQAGAGGSAGSGATCGTRSAGPCADGSYCEFPSGADCGRSDRPGRCKAKPGACTFELNPVCGCDGNTYSNPCAAASAGVSVESQGECEQATKVDCDHRKAACDEVPQPCPGGQVRALQAACYGECVTVDRCACSERDACPEPDSYTCHMSAGRCGPYV